jgi:hypothetical protein
MIFKLMRNNNFIGGLFGALIVLNAHAIVEGWYR